MKLSKLASAMPFAHFLGLPAATVARAEDDDDDRKQRDGESDDDYAKRMEEQDKKDEESRSARGEGDDPKDPDAEDEDDDDDADMEDGDDEDKKDDKETGKRAGRAQGARQRERARCAAIVAAGIKAGAVNQACVFAFDTTMTSKQAVAALGAAALDKPKGRAGLADRMAAVKVAVVTPQGDATPPSDAKALADRAIAAAARARGQA